MFIKYQNFYLMIILFVIFYIYKKQKQRYGVNHFIIIFLVLICIPLYENIIIEIDTIRKNFWVEDGRNIFSYQSIVQFSDLFYLSILSFIKSIFNPLLYKTTNLFQLIQSIENLLIFLFLIIFTSKCYKQNVLTTNKWLFFFIFSMTLNGLVIENIGTLSRYKYSFIVLYVIGLSYELFKLNTHSFKKFFKKKI